MVEKIVEEKKVEKKERPEKARISPPTPRISEKKSKEEKIPEMKIFGRWSSVGIEVKDVGIKPYIVLEPRLMPKSYSRFVAKKPFYKSKLNIIERLINHLFVVGHKGKKHKIYSGRNVGKTLRATNTLIKAFELIEKEGKNPVGILVQAVENSAPLGEVISYQKGGIFVREGVVTAPQRRVDLALRHLAQGTMQKSFSSKKSAAQALAEELLAAAKGDSSASYAVAEKVRREKEAAEAR